MGALTPTMLVRLEDRIQNLAESEYARMTANLWWQQVAKVRPSTGKKDIIRWLLSTAQIRDRGDGGNIAFDDLVGTYTEIENRDSGAGLKLRRQQLEDVDGGGFDLAGQWATDIGAYMAYWPQKQVSYFLKNAHTASLFTGYDAKAFFATDHPVNPLKTSVGTFKNLLTGGDAADISDAVTVDVALANLAKVFSHIASIKMPNGEDPRFLRPKALLVPPKLFPRAAQLTNAKYVAQAAATGGGGADVEMLIRAMGYASPIMCDELAGFESDTTYFVIAEQAASSQLGGVIYVEREPFKINFFGEMSSADLSRKDELEWHCKGRNVIAPGHPYLIFKVKAA